MARALYIHWPFCLAKCPYCDFNSHVRERVDHAVWQDSLLADMRREAELAGGERLESVFFGGGTPSLMPPALVARLLGEAERLWDFGEGIEITLEGNPSSVEAANYADLAAAGINRASLGLQALDDPTLRFLGRLHGASEGLKALEVAQEHFKRVSFDLIYARPGQSEADWRRELDRALGFGTGHLSLSLAPFVKRVIAVDGSAAMLRTARVRVGDLPNVELRRGELESLPLEAECLDLACLVAVLSSVASPAQVILEAARVLRPGARLLVTDMMPHDRAEFRQTMGHQRLGVSEEELLGWMAAARLEKDRNRLVG